MSVNGHTEFFKKGISTGLKSGSVAEGRVKSIFLVLLPRSDQIT